MEISLGRTKPRAVFAKITLGGQNLAQFLQKSRLADKISRSFHKNYAWREKPRTVFAENSFGRVKRHAAFVEISFRWTKPHAVFTEITIGQEKRPAVLQKIRLNEEIRVRLSKKFHFEGQNAVCFCRKSAWTRKSAQQTSCKKTASTVITEAIFSGVAEK